MHAIGMAGERQVGMVVDDEDRVVRLAERRDRPRVRELVALITPLVAPLHQARAALERPSATAAGARPPQASGSMIT